MLKSLLRATVFASSLLVAGGALLTPAFAEVVYNRGSAAEPESVDPHKTSTIYEAHVMRDLFEGLVMQDSKADLIPGAAESWTVSDDGKIYTFKLRPDATWSDGSPVTAEDFVYSFRRLEDPATAAEYASMLYPIVNAEEVNTGKAKPEEMGVKAIDATTLEVTLKAPTPYFLEMLTHQATYPVNKASIEKLGADWIKPGNLVSNGAFTLAELVPNDHIKMVKNPKFHDAANVKIDVVNFIPTEDRSSAMKRFEAGELDSYDDLPTEQLADLKAKFGDQIRVAPYLGTYYYAIKTDKAPWDNVELRNADLHGHRPRLPGREGLAATRCSPATRWCRPASRATRSAMASFADKSQIDREDEAKAILEKLGYGPDKPLKMEIRYNTSENHKNTAVAIQEQLKPLGIEVTLLNTDTKTHYGHPRAEGRLRRRPRRLDRRLQGSGNLPRHLAQGERQQLLELRQPEIRGGDGQGRGRRRQSGRAPEAAQRGRAHPDRRSRQHSAALLQLPQHRVAEARRLRRQRHGRSSVALHQQAIAHAGPPLHPESGGLQRRASSWCAEDAVAHLRIGFRKPVPVSELMR